MPLKKDLSHQKSTKKHEKTRIMPFKAESGCAKMRENEPKNGTKKLEKS